MQSQSSVGCQWDHRGSHKGVSPRCLVREEWAECTQLAHLRQDEAQSVGVGDSSRLGKPVFNDHYDSVKSGTKIQRTSHTTSQVDNRERYEKEMQEIGNLDVWREGTL